MFTYNVKSHFLLANALNESRIRVVVESTGIATVTSTLQQA